MSYVTFLGANDGPPEHGVLTIGQQGEPHRIPASPPESWPKYLYLHILTTETLILFLIARYDQPDQRLRSAGQVRSERHSLLL